MEIELTKPQLDKISKHILKELWNTFDENDILKVRGNKMMLAGRILTREDMLSLKSGAVTALNMEVLAVIFKEMKVLANRSIYESKVIDDTMFGKAVLFALNTIEAKLKNLAEMKVE